jgi:hypothetical protein
MFKNDLERQSFIQNVTSGPNDGIYFLLHAIRDKSCPAFEAPSLNGWPLGTVIPPQGLDEGDPIYTEFFSISAPALPDDLRGTLSKSLTCLINQGSSLAWFVFEFIFDESNALGGVWGPSSVYGFATSSSEPKLALSKSEREQSTWSKALQSALEDTYRQYPQLKKLETATGFVNF